MMKNPSYSSTAISMNPTKELKGFDIKISGKEKREVKGFFKSVLGAVYFVTLMYSLFILLT